MRYIELVYHGSISYFEYGEYDHQTNRDIPEMVNIQKTMDRSTIL